MRIGAVLLKACRSFFYRILPLEFGKFFHKKLSGFERRWNLEVRGFTKQGFFVFFRRHFRLDAEKGLLAELSAGDGLVGSLGLWLESSKCGWEVVAWENRKQAHVRFAKNRPHTPLHAGLLTDWSKQGWGHRLVAVTSRSARETAALCRAIRGGLVRPKWLGIWNPTKRPVWFHRMQKQGYRLECVWQNMEFYRT